MKNLFFTHHAHDRLEERGVSQRQVYDTLKNPDDIQPSKKGLGRFVAEKHLETGQTLRVIYTEEGDFYVIISVIKMGRQRRAGQ